MTIPVTASAYWRPKVFACARLFLLDMTETENLFRALAPRVTEMVFPYLWPDVWRRAARE